MALPGLPRHLSTKQSNIGRSYGYVPTNETVDEDLIQEDDLEIGKEYTVYPKSLPGLQRRVTYSNKVGPILQFKIPNTNNFAFVRPYKELYIKIGGKSKKIQKNKTFKEK
jgi:hypothetical protein